MAAPGERDPSFGAGRNPRRPRELEPVPVDYFSEDGVGAVFAK
jgi:hypothetical protein